MAAEILISLATLPLRLVLGILYLTYGFQKLKNLERTETIFLKLRLHWPKLSATTISIIEFFGGIALLVGFLTRIIASLLAIQIGIIAYKKIRTKKFNYGLDLILIVALVLLVILGAGNLSIDQIFGWLLG